MTEADLTNQINQIKVRAFDRLRTAMTMKPEYLGYTSRESAAIAITQETMVLIESAIAAYDKEHAK